MAAYERLAELPANLSEVLSRTARAHGDRVALALGDKLVTYAELDGLVTALAANLAGLGVAAGDRVAFNFPNVPQFVVCYFAAARLGALAVPINCLLAADEIEFVLQHSGAETFISLDLLAELGAEALKNCPGVKHFIVSGEKRPEGALSFEALLAPPAAVPAFASAAPEDVAVIKYTSGTTGRPKGAMLTHRNLIFDADSCDVSIGVGPEDIFISVLPLFHCFGATVCMILPVLLGAKSVLVPRFTGSAALSAIQAHRATIFAGVPSMFALMLRARAEEEFDLGSLRICVTGGAPITREVFQGFEQRFNVEMLEGYGPTEAAPVVTVNPLVGVRKLGSVGPPLAGISVRICGDAGDDLPVGEVGEICVQGPNVMLGYWQDPEATAATVVDGWLHTGDMGRLDEDGYLYISGRKKELIIVGGMNVYPREIEEVIEDIPEVAESAVIGVPDPLRGESPVAFVICKPGETLTEAQVIAACRERLGSYKIPSQVVFREQFVRSATGKILKRVLGELLK